MPELIKTAEIRDKRAWAETTFPGARLGRKPQPNYQSRVEIEKLKSFVPMKVLKQKVEECELRDYRAKAGKLTPKGEYYGMKNYHRSLSVASYFSRGILFGYPKKGTSPSLHELVVAQDQGVEDEVFIENGLSSSRSESSFSGSTFSRQTKSDSELMSQKLMSKKVNSSSSHKLLEYNVTSNSRSRKSKLQGSKKKKSLLIKYFQIYPLCI